jgi:hypothetical protein
MKEKLILFKNRLFCFVLMIFSSSNNTLNEQEEKPNLWMKEVYHAIKDLRITQISLPGTHHSFFSPTGLFSLVHGNFSRCQSITAVEKQFNVGIRLFDLRVSLNSKDGEFYISHRFLSKVKLSTVLGEISQVISKYPSEIILLFIREDYDNPLANELERLELDSLIQNSLGNQLIPNFLHNRPFSDLLTWGNIVCFGIERDKRTNYWDFKYSFPFTQYSSHHPYKLIESVCEYLEKDLIPFGCINILDTVIGLNQWNFYLGIQRASKRVNQALKEKLIESSDTFQPRGNAFLIDYYHNHLDLVSVIISLNLKKQRQINST